MSFKGNVASGVLEVVVVEVAVVKVVVEVETEVVVVIDVISKE